ncbi:hypothetical protein ETD85_54045 [Nonomuraea zeae]|uniref:Uncharacterized protein n=1 Tax=Nonomuraea zeae TaxID=1642303 RepID=A0A5S4FFF4_9ACTN|nr:hypothetical protein ETD85_54045 [Nonomuraea zeae]
MDDEVSGFFFTRLYHELHEGNSRLRAFKVAQTATQDGFQYCDWGAFSYAGDWR